jgi:tetratricopeptide (TPR) repeat protein
MSEGEPSSERKIDPALGEAVRILRKRPALAETRLREILATQPEDLNATIWLCRALRAQAKFTDTIETLEALKTAHPGFAVAHYELALVRNDLGERGEAVAGIREAVRIDPNFTNARLVLGDILFEKGDKTGADEAYMAHIRISANAPHIREAMAALHKNQFHVAEAVLKAHLARLPGDLAAIIVLGETKSRLSEYEVAANIFAKSLQRVPSFDVARLNYATVLCRLQRSEEALVQAGHLLKRDPRNPRFLTLEATALNLCGKPAQAIRCFEALLADNPDDYMSWTAYGHVLRGENKVERAVDAYRRSLALNPSHGSAYWGLANLKTIRFSSQERQALENAAAGDGLSEDDRVQCHFALAKALEDETRFKESFGQYVAGNSLKFAQLFYNPAQLSRSVRQSKKFFTRAFFESRRGAGAPARDPIFILGLPRSGSTLIEQILASHSAIEGTAELPELRFIVDGLREQNTDGRTPPYPQLLAGLPPAELRILGEDYLARTRHHRSSTKPFFTDKMPANFEHLGFIALTLPNAKIIDARRHPMGCCFSNFKQYYVEGQRFTYDLTALGLYYRDYVELMAYFDAVLPGRIHRVFHENMVADPEREIRRLLDYCGLPLEDSCLKFYETDRRVSTISSEQVRQPIFSDGVDHWRYFEPWLGPLKEALGPVLDAYPAAPAAFLADTVPTRH